MKSNATFEDRNGNTLKLTADSDGGFSLILNDEMAFDFDNAADVKTATRSFNSTVKSATVPDAE